MPTDVEVHDGLLYVTTLPGGPEDPSLGARGKVYTVDPATGDVTQIGKGFAGATDLAVSPQGKVYVTELFGGQVSTIKNGVAKKVFSVEQPAAIEWAQRPPVRRRRSRGTRLGPQVHAVTDQT